MLNRRRFVYGIGAVMSLPVVGCGKRDEVSVAPADTAGATVTIFENGTVLPVDPGFSEHEAIAVSGNRVLAVGSRAHVRQAAGAAPRVVDLAGRVMLPGFTDLYVLGIGPVAEELSGMFDAYWNHETALPVPAFAEMPDDPTSELVRLRAKFERSRSDVMDTAYAEAVRREVLDYIETDEPSFTWAPYKLVFDSPDKGMKSRASEAGSIRTPLKAALESARHELLVITPYFIPTDRGIERFKQLRSAGVDVLVATNSLASTN